MAYWLMKSEPDVYSIDDLIAKPGPDIWEGCRNYTVRNYMRDTMQVGDGALFYHSNASPSGVVGSMIITRTGYPDPTQFDPNSEYYDPKAPADGSRWLAVDVAEPVKFDRVLSLADLRAEPELAEMWVLRRGQRLSVMPVTEAEWDHIHRLVGQTPRRSAS